MRSSCATLFSRYCLIADKASCNFVIRADCMHRRHESFPRWKYCAAILQRQLTHIRRVEGLFAVKSADSIGLESE